MLQWDKAWRSTREHLRFHEHKSGEILSKAPSQFLKVLHACTITKEENNLLISNSSLVRTRFFLDLSWDELRKSVCPLRKILGNDQGKLYELFIYASDPSLCPKPASIFSDLSRGYLRVMRSYLDHRLPWDFRWLVRSNWGDVLRSCPPCDVMLKDVRELESASAGTSFFEYTYSHDFHNILQWLKTFPEPPDDLIARFEDHLECSILEDRVPGMATTFDELEEKWMSWRKDMVGCSALLQEVG
ncbi:hypothetical protein C8R44DRAFT_821672 [Mycena epipterygia]|nr:hypothetical protein C8R44DRAFT_821672 [Mycena epipterygia]